MFIIEWELFLLGVCLLYMNNWWKNPMETNWMYCIYSKYKFLWYFALRIVSNSHYVDHFMLIWVANFSAAAKENLSMRRDRTHLSEELEFLQLTMGSEHLALATNHIVSLLRNWPCHINDNSRGSSHLPLSTLPRQRAVENLDRMNQVFDSYNKEMEAKKCWAWLDLGDV